MRLRRLRMLLWSFASAMALSALAALAWTITRQPDAAIAPADSHGSTSAVSAATQPMVDPADLQQVMRVELRRPLHDPPPLPPPAAPAAKPFPPLDIKLAGTIVEPGHCQAMIQFPDGSVQLKSVGDSADDAVIQDIQEGSITVEFHGQMIGLTVPKEN